MRYLLFIVVFVVLDWPGFELQAQSMGFNLGTTRAVVVGVSDYQNQGIPNLKFAHRDAAAFAEFLKSKAGGSLTDEEMKVLLNEEATTAAMVAALDWLIEQTMEGDECIIYFSGHGDVETRTRRQLGFLLTWDSPARAYMAGAFPLFYLEEIINTLTLDKQAKVILVADACRSGKLAGSAVSGAQLTSANLAQQFSNEIKILSCQPNEYSIEGEQWGGGRGVFSFHLMNGLYGLADRNNDFQVNLMEIGRYLEDHVPEEVAPSSQIPLTVGPRSDLVSRVDPEKVELLANNDAKPSGEILASTRSPASKPAAKVEMGPEEIALLVAFREMLKEGIDLVKTDSLFQIMKTKQEFVAQLPSIKREYATALQDEVQQALNSLLDSDPYESNTFYFNPESYNLYPQFLQRSIDLLGGDHYVTPDLMAKKYFFEAFNITRLLSESDKFGKSTRDSLRTVAGKLLNQAIDIQPSASYLYYGKAFEYAHRTPSRIDSVLHYSIKANEWSPKWLLPYLGIVREYMYTLFDYPKAEEWLLKAQNINPDAFIVIEHLCWLYQTLGKQEEAKKMAEKMIELKPDLFNGYGNLGGVYFQSNDYSEARKWYEKALEQNDDPGTFVPQYYGYTLMATRKQEAGERYYDDYLQLDNAPYWLKAKASLFHGKGLINYGTKYEKAIRVLEEALKRQHAPYAIAENKIYIAQAKMKLGLWEEARTLLEECFEYEPEFINAFILGYSLMGEILEQANDLEKAEEYYKKGVDYQGSNFFKIEALYRNGLFLLRQKRMEEAREMFDLCNWMTGQKGYEGYLGLSLLHAHQKRDEEAIDFLEKALNNYYPSEEFLLAEPLYENLRKSDRFKALMNKHFPR